jgi:hypothetical protein
MDLAIRLSYLNKLAHASRYQTLTLKNKYENRRRLRHVGGGLFSDWHDRIPVVEGWTSRKCPTLTSDSCRVGAPDICPQQTRQVRECNDGRQVLLCVLLSLNQNWGIS